MTRFGPRRRATGGGTAAALVAILMSPLIATPAWAAPEPAASSVPAGSTVAEPDISTAGDFAIALLQQGSWPVTGNNVCAVLAWENAEGGHFISGSSRFNPLNTTQSMPGDSIFNSVGVRNYPNWSTGLTATVTTIDLPYYAFVRMALLDGKSAVSVLQAVQTSEWGTKFENPAASLSSECMARADAFDRERTAAQVAVTEASASLTSAQEAKTTAEQTQSALELKYQKMADQVSAAKAQLGELARSLYISGIEPAVASKFEAIESGDPVGYSTLTSYSGYAGTRKAVAVRRAVGLLGEMDATREQAAKAVSDANAAVAGAQQELVKSQQNLAQVEGGISTQF